MSGSRAVACYDDVGTTSTRAPLGKVWPNLVFIKDSGKQCVEFRVQCEILLPPSVASRLEPKILGPDSSAETRREVLDELLEHAHDDAQEVFTSIVTAALLNQPGD